MVRHCSPPQDFFAEHFHVRGRFDPDADLASFNRHHPNGDVQARQGDGLMETAREDKHGGLLSGGRECGGGSTLAVEMSPGM
jgi:hypothetical protein